MKRIEIHIWWLQIEKTPLVSMVYTNLFHCCKCEISTWTSSLSLHRSRSECGWSAGGWSSWRRSTTRRSRTWSPARIPTRSCSFRISCGCSRNRWRRRRDTTTTWSFSSWRWDARICCGKENGSTFSTTWGCVSLPRSTTSSGWKLIIFVSPPFNFN